MYVRPTEQRCAGSRRAIQLVCLGISAYGYVRVASIDAMKDPNRILLGAKENVRTREDNVCYGWESFIDSSGLRVRSPGSR